MHVVSTIPVEPDASMDAVAFSCAAVVKDCSKLNCSYNKGRISSEQANVQVHWGNNFKNSFKVEDRENVIHMTKMMMIRRRRRVQMVMNKERSNSC